MIKFLNKTPKIELLSLSNLFVVNKVWIVLFKTLFLQCLQCRKRKYSFTLPHGVYIRLNVEGCRENKVVKKYTAKMGLMRGRAPIRRTMEYLKQGKLFLKPNLKIMLSNVIPNHPASSGLQ